VGVLLTVLLYLTPIFYPEAIVPARFRWILRWNPVRPILDAFRQPIWAGALPPASSLAAAAAVALLVLLAGWAGFRRMSDRIPFYL
jgi:ABC-type polysaccharide/polyol phosphate export permease